MNTIKSLEGPVPLTLLPVNTPMRVPLQYVKYHVFKV